MVDNVAHLTTIFILQLDFSTNNFLSLRSLLQKLLDSVGVIVVFCFQFFGAQLLLVILYFFICEVGPVKFYQTPAIIKKILGHKKDLSHELINKLQLVW